MTWELAGLCCGVNILGFIYSYHCCLRIYNRFKIIGNTEDRIDYDHDQAQTGAEQSDFGYCGSSNSVDSVEESSSLKRRKSKDSKGLGFRLFGFRSSSASTGKKVRKSSSSRRDSGGDQFFVAVSGGATPRVHRAGFMTMKMPDSAWKRLYFAMYRENLYYYNNHTEFERDPSKSLSR